MQKGIEEWVRCNTCFRSMQESSRVFHITQCQHIFCTFCLVAVKKKCPVCNSLEILTMKLEKPLQQSIRPFFRPVSEHLELADRAATLQRTQALLTMQLATKTQQKYQTLKKAVYQVENMRKSIKAACKVLKEDSARKSRQLAMYQKSATVRSGKQLFIPSNYNNFHTLPEANHSNAAGPANRCAREFPMRPTNSHTSMSYSALLKNSQRENSKSLMEHEILSRRSVAKDSIAEERRSNFQPHEQSTTPFTPFQYSPRVVLSDSSADSTMTPVGQQIVRKILKTMQISTNASSSDGSLYPPNYCHNRPYFDTDYHANRT